MLKIVLLLAISLIFSQSVMAGLPPKPEQCPSIDRVRAEGFSEVQAMYSDTTFFVFNYSHYDLQEQWGFLLLTIKADNKTKAIQKGNLVLQSISGSPIPVLDENDEDWICVYQTLDGYFAAAIPTRPDHVLSHLQRK